MNSEEQRESNGKHLKEITLQAREEILNVKYCASRTNIKGKEKIETSEM